MKYDIEYTMADTCVSYFSLPSERCTRDNKTGSVFCDVHSMQYSALYWRYKSIEANPVKSIQDALTSTLLKQVARYQSAIELRQKFRDDAIAYECRDVGHEFRIDTIHKEIQSILDELKARFDKQPVPGVSDVPAPKHNAERDLGREIEYIAEYKTAFKKYEKTKKKDQDWEDNVNKYISMSTDERNNARASALFSWRQYVFALGLEDRCTLDRLDIAQLLFETYLKCSNDLVTFYYFNLGHIMQYFAISHKLVCRSLMISNSTVSEFPKIFPEEVIVATIKSFELLDKMIDDAAGRVDQIFISCPILLAKYRGIWYVGKRFSCFIQIGTSNDYRITESDPEPRNGLSYEENDVIIRKEFQSDIIKEKMRMRMADTFPEFDRYRELQREHSLSAMDLAIKKIQIAQNLPYPKYLEYRNKALKEFDSADVEYPTMPCKDIMHHTFPVGTLLKKRSRTVSNIFTS